MAPKVLVLGHSWVARLEETCPNIIAPEEILCSSQSGAMLDGMFRLLELQPLSEIKCVVLFGLLTEAYERVFREGRSQFRIRESFCEEEVLDNLHRIQDFLEKNCPPGVQLVVAIPPSWIWTITIIVVLMEVPQQSRHLLLAGILESEISRMVTLPGPTRRSLKWK